jgi:hypothetical protein
VRIGRDAQRAERANEGAQRTQPKSMSHEEQQAAAHHHADVNRELTEHAARSFAIPAEPAKIGAEF